ncbi:hypothetical protein [Aquimarina rhabdastrellae]
MKKYILYTLSLFAATCIVSCDSDDDVANEELVVTPHKVTVGFTNTDTQDVVLEDGGVASVEIVLSEALPFDGELVFEATSSDGSIETIAADDSVITEVSIPQSVTVPAGTTTVTADFSFVNDNIDDFSEVYTLKIKDFVTQGSSIETYLVGENLTKEVNVVDELPRVVTVADGDVAFRLDFPLALDADFGLFYTDRVIDNDLLVGSGVTFANPEEFTWASSTDEGRFSLFVQEFNGAFPLDYTLTITFPDGSEEVYTRTITENGFVLLVDKVINSDGTITYTLAQTN